MGGQGFSSLNILAISYCVTVQILCWTDGTASNRTALADFSFLASALNAPHVLSEVISAGISFVVRFCSECKRGSLDLQPFIIFHP